MTTPLAPQLCAHLRVSGRGRRTTVAGGLVVELCKACVQELGDRFTELERDPTPIEQQARRAEVEMVDGCTYDIGKKEFYLCEKVCEPGEVYCPKHKAVAEYEKQLAAKRDHEKEMRRGGPSKITPYTGPKK